jgi:CheY-like chemotaxis protein
MSDKTKILVVEDNDFVRMQIVRYLTETGADVIEASRGDQALDFVVQQYKQRTPIALAIVDVRMEPVDGFEFIKSIRGMDMDTPVILVTGDNNPDLLEKAGTWGVSAVMIKPVQKDRLLKTVERTVEAQKRRGQG